MAWQSGLSNYGQAYKIGDAQNPFFQMQGMLPQAGLQPGAVQGGVIPGAGSAPPILGRPMLPPGVTPEMAALPQGIPGLGAPLGKVAPAKPVKAKTTKRVIPKDPSSREQGRGQDARSEREGGKRGGDPGGFGGGIWR